MRLLKSTRQELDTLQKLPQESPASPVGIPLVTKPARSSSLLDQLQFVKYEKNGTAASLQGEVSKDEPKDEDSEKDTEKEKEKESENDDSESGYAQLVFGLNMFISV